MDWMLTSDALGGAGVTLGAVFVTLVMRLLRHAAAFAENANRMAERTTTALDASIRYFEAASTHQVREEELLAGIYAELAGVPQSIPRVSTPAPAPMQAVRQ